ncbi:MAG: hypothetical protein U0U69_01570 [Acidimicrobiia bacterium]
MAKKRTMSDDHKAAIAAGRSEGTAVRRYLEALKRKRRPGRRFSKAQLAERLEELQSKVDAEDNPLVEVELRQKARDLESRIASSDQELDETELEAAFVVVAKDFSQRKNISYSVWRDMGVPASVLKKAGIPQERSRTKP